MSRFHPTKPAVTYQDTVTFMAKVESAVPEYYNKLTKIKGKAKKLTETDGKEYTYKNVEPSKIYRFRVKYPTADGLSKASESYNITVAADAKKPVVTATAKNGKIILKWNKVPGATEYAVYRVNSKGKLTKAGSTKKTQMVISQRPTDKGYAVKALVNGKWTTVTKADIAVVSE